MPISQDDFQYVNPQDRDVRPWLVVQVFISAVDMIWWTITLPFTLLSSRTDRDEKLGARYDKFHNN